MIDDGLKNNTKLLRLPQEDMCQAFGLPSSIKYEADGGPSIKTIMDRLMGSSQSLKDRDAFIRFQVLRIRSNRLGHNNDSN